MSSDLQRRRLIDEIHEQLEADNAPLTPIVRKAVRLAGLCGDPEHRLLFELHLNGVEVGGRSGFRVQPWPEDGSSPRWNIVEAFRQDRAAAEGQVQAMALQQIEDLLKKIRREASSSSMRDFPAARSKLLEPEMVLSRVLDRVRNRVAAFVRMAESSLPDTQEIGADKFDESRRISVAHSDSPGGMVLVTRARDLREFAIRHKEWLIPFIFGVLFLTSTPWWTSKIPWTVVRKEDLRPAVAFLPGDFEVTNGHTWTTAVDVRIEVRNAMVRLGRSAEVIHQEFEPDWLAYGEITPEVELESVIPSKALVENDSATVTFVFDSGSLITNVSARQENYRGDKDRIGTVAIKLPYEINGVLETDTIHIPVYLVGR